MICNMPDSDGSRKIIISDLPDYRVSKIIFILDKSGLRASETGIKGINSDSPYYFKEV